MEEGILLKIALVSSLIGILLLSFIEEKISLKESNITMIDYSLLENHVKVKGAAVNIKDLENILIFDLKDNNGKIKVIAFKKNKLKIKKDSILEVEGIVKEYNNELEVEAKKIRIL